jgi:cell wall-associated NlpC family hydrolase
MRNFLLITSFLVCAFAMLSCHDGKKTVSRASNKNPKFLDDVYVGKHHKTSVIRQPKEEEIAEVDKTVKDTTEIPIIKFKKDESEPPSCYVPRDLKEVHISKSEQNKLIEKYAAMMNVSAKDISNVLLYRFIDEWYGVDYRYGGCDKAGIDCSAFVQRLYNQVFGVDLVRTAVEQFNNCSLIKHINKMTEGDLVFFHIHSKHITHVGIYLMNDYFVHASSSQGVMISNLNENYWTRYFACAGRVNKKDRSAVSE